MLAYVACKVNYQEIQGVFIVPIFQVKSESWLSRLLFVYSGWPVQL